MLNGVGSITKAFANNYYLRVFGITNLSSIIIPLFNKFPLHGAKLLDFNDFCSGISIINAKNHLTPEGLTTIKNLYYGRNSYRPRNSKSTRK